MYSYKAVMVNMDSKFYDEMDLENLNRNNNKSNRNICVADSRETFRKNPTKCGQTSDDLKIDVTPIKKHRQSLSLPVTPKKKANGVPSDDPLTPTANLKMLVSAAFDHATSKDVKSFKEKRDLFNQDEDVQEDSCSTVSDLVDDKDKYVENEDCDLNNQFEPVICGSRKLKSLGLLCQKFLQKYPDDVEGQEINLHDIAKDLQVERRRIYDIVNVLESLEYVTKKGKNTYTWHGSKRLIPTLCKLKALAHNIYSSYNIDNSAHGMNLPQEWTMFNDKTMKIPRVWLRNGIVIGEQELDETDMNYVTMYNKEEETKRRQNKSLGIFCQKLIMLFMVSKDQTVALEKAAREVIEVKEDPLGKNKTKVRRIYDIANILSSMDLIKKTAALSGSRKTMYKWTGVDLDSLQPDTETLEKTLSGSDAYAPTKHSLFSQPAAMADLKLGSKSIRKLEARSASASEIRKRQTNKMPRTKSAATISRKRSSSTEDKNGAGQTMSNSISETYVGKSEQEMPVNMEVGGEPVRTNISGAQLVDARTPLRQNNSSYGLVSPSERMFREEIKKLCDRFPGKVQENDGLLQLLNACNQDEIPKERDGFLSSTGDRGRCRLLDRIENKDAPLTKRARNEAACSQTIDDSPASQLRDKQIASMKLIPKFTEEEGKQCEVSSNLHRHGSMDVSFMSQDKMLQNSNLQGTLVQPVQKASVGIQACLTNGRSPLKMLQNGLNSPKQMTYQVSVSSPDAASPGLREINFVLHRQTEMNGSKEVSSDVSNELAISKEFLSPDNVRVSKACLVSTAEHNSPETTPTGRPQIIDVSTSLYNPCAALNKLVSSHPLQGQAFNILQQKNLQQKNGNVIQMVSIPPFPFNILQRTPVSEKENFPGLQNIAKSSGSKKSTPLSDNLAKLLFPILPKKMNPDCEETPVRCDIKSNFVGKKQVNKINLDI